MHDREDDPDHQKDGRESQNLILDRCRRDQQTFGEVGTGQHEGHEKDDALDDVILRATNIRIGPGFQTDRRACAADELAPRSGGHGFFGQIEFFTCTIVEIRQSLIFDRKTLEFLHSRFIQRPHVSGGQIRCLCKTRLRFDRITGTEGFCFALGRHGVEQERAKSEQPSSQAHLDFRPRTREQNAYRLVLGGWPLADGVAVFDR